MVKTPFGNRVRKVDVQVLEPVRVVVRYPGGYLPVTVAVYYKVGNRWILESFHVEKAASRKLEDLVEYTLDAWLPVALVYQQTAIKAALHALETGKAEIEVVEDPVEFKKLRSEINW
jgi:hypothetical protein